PVGVALPLSRYCTKCEREPVNMQLLTVTFIVAEPAVGATDMLSAALPNDALLLPQVTVSIVKRLSVPLVLRRRRSSSRPPLTDEVLMLAVPRRLSKATLPSSFASLLPFAPLMTECARVKPVTVLP